MNDDLISRQAALDYLIDALYDLDEADYVDNTFIEEELQKVPAIYSEQKTGRWLINSDGYYPYCSICKNEPQGRIMTDYCQWQGLRHLFQMVAKHGHEAPTGA